MVGALNGGIKFDPVAGIAEAQAEFDVLDAGTLVRHGVKATRSLEGVAANGAAASPEGCGGTGVAAVGVVVKQVAEAAHDPRGGGAVVVAAEHCRQGWISAETGSDALDRSGVQFHIGIHEQQDLAAGRSGGQVASSGRPLP